MGLCLNDLLKKVGAENQELAIKNAELTEEITAATEQLQSLKTESETMAEYQMDLDYRLSCQELGL